MEKLIFAESNIDAMKESARIIIETALDRKISDADPLWIFTCSLLTIIVQQRFLIDEAANQNLLYYSTGKNLEALGQLVGVQRLPESSAFCTAEIELSAPRQKETVIRKGTRFNAGDNVHFALEEDVIFLAGEISKTCHAICQQAGTIGNGYKVGELCKIVDPQPYLSKISNITETTGGADVESDDDLRERIRLAPSSFSVAGSRQSYEFWAKTASDLISDVYCDSPTPGFVDVYILQDGGKIPNEELINLVYETLSDEKIRPLTDFVTVKPPEIVSYEIELRYFISRKNQTSALAIKEAAEKAVTDFISWQSEKLGRDLNQTELYWRLRGAGVKRAEIISPQFSIVPPNAVAICDNINITYGGLEDD